MNGCICDGIYGSLLQAMWILGIISIPMWIRLIIEHYDRKEGKVRR